MKALLWAKVKCLNGRWHKVGLSKSGEVVLPHHTHLTGDPNAQSATVMHGLGATVRCVEVKGAWERARTLDKKDPKRSWAVASLPEAFRDALKHGIEETAEKIDARPGKLKSKRASHAARKVAELKTRIKLLTTRLKTWTAKLKRYEKDGVEIKAPKKRTRQAAVAPTSPAPAQASTITP
jgi:hypothetical protein